MVDVLPEQTSLWQAIEGVAREHFSRAGIKEIRTPILEATDLFARGIGEATDVVGKEMYTFSDRGDRSCTLRPEGTASVVRAAIENGLLTQGGQRLWYEGPMFRYERPQAGRQRQFHQLGIEFLGLKEPMNDAEVISIAWHLLNDLGLKDLELEINSLGTESDRDAFRTRFVSWLESRRSELDPDSQQRLKTNPLRILDSKDKKTKVILESAPKLSELISAESRHRFLHVQQSLEDLGIPFQVNEQLVRGLDYYDHTAFEITNSQLGAQSTVCGGGRYDRLVQELGGPATPAIGWAIGLERLILLMTQQANQNPLGKSAQLSKLKKPDLYIVNQGVDAKRKALVIAQKLRDAGLRVELDSSTASFGKQFKRADRSGADYAFVIGDEEVKTGQAPLKYLRDSSTKNKEVSTEKLLHLDDLESLISTIHKEQNIH